MHESLIEDKQARNKMTPKHITLATIATLLTICTTVFGSYRSIKNYVDQNQQAQLKQAIQHEKHDWEIDRRLDNLELAVKAAVSNDGSKQQRLIDQILDLKAQMEDVKDTQEDLKDSIGAPQEVNYVNHKTHYDVPMADAPAAKPKPEDQE
jgi:hypothetical protein